MSKLNVTFGYHRETMELMGASLSESELFEEWILSGLQL